MSISDPFLYHRYMTSFHRTVGEARNQGRRVRGWNSVRDRDVGSCALQCTADEARQGVPRHSRQQTTVNDLTTTTQPPLCIGLSFVRLVGAVIDSRNTRAPYPPGLWEGIRTLRPTLRQRPPGPHVSSSPFLVTHGLTLERLAYVPSVRHLSIGMNLTRRYTRFLHTLTPRNRSSTIREGE